MPQNLSLKEFLIQPGPMLDVRSPSEFIQGRIPGSFSFPLFSDAERAQIGTVYKKRNRQEAVELGLLLLEPKLESLLQEASSLCTSSARVICWRGGMRSGFTARLMELMGNQISTLQGGYKAYRRWALQRLENLPSPLQTSKIVVIGGLTGSGKTALLQKLHQLGEQILDLEALANHRGSVFGGIGFPPQPTQEQFENELALQLEQIDWSRPVWVEDESRLIGQRHLPFALYQGIINAPLFFLTCPLNERLQNLLNQYGNAPLNQLKEATARIAKRLGSRLTEEIQYLFEQEKRELAFEKLLFYYDKSYQHQMAKRKAVHSLTLKERFHPQELACALQHFYKQNIL